MAGRFLDSFLNKQVDAGLLEQKEIEVYRYGYLLVLELSIEFLIAVLIGFITGSLPFILFFLLVFIPLRSYCGGYHAASFIRCVILSNVIIIAVLAVVEFCSLNVVLLVIAECIGLGAILAKAPCQCAAKSIDAREKKKYRKNIYIILVIEIILGVLLWNANVRLLSLIVIAHFVVGMSVLVGKR